MLEPVPHPDDELLAAAYDDDLPRLRKALSSGADANALDSVGRTALHRAVRFSERFDRIEVVKELLKAGAQISRKDPAGNTPLHIVARKGDSDISMLEVLLDHGASILAENNEGFTPRDFSSISTAQDHVETTRVLDLAANQQGHAGRVTGERKDKGPPQVGG